MSKSSFYSGSGLTNTEQDAIEGAKNAAEAARDAAQAAQAAAETARDSAQSSSSTASGHAATATTKANEASGSANTANTHASTATTKASEASTSASNAATSETNASDDADDAQKLAINAEDSQFTLSDGSTTGYSALHHKEKALDAQTAAETAQTAAETAQSSATTSSATATTKASEASTSATNAATSETNAATSATNAATSETNAATSETNAAASATTASTQASNASSSASDALSHKNAAASSASSASSAQTAAETAKTGAETAETAAETAQAAAEAALADFEGIYLGPHASDPTQDANGDNVGVGDLYFNTTNSELLVYNGTNWVTSGVTTTATTSDNGLMSSSDKTKLDGIEASADVTDAANVDPLVDTHLNVSGASSGQFLKYNGSDYAWDDVDLSSKLSLTGGTLTGNLDLNNANIVFEGATADDFETTLTVTDPTADRTITFGDQTGKVMLWQSAWPDDPSSTISGNYAIGENTLSSPASNLFGAVAIGKNAGTALTTGSYTVAIGLDALKTSTTGGNNVAIGYAAGEDVTSNANVAIGAFSLQNKTTGSNTGVGYGTLTGTGTGDDNTAVGAFAGYELTSADGCAFLGYNAGRETTTALNNIAIGYNAAPDNQAGSYWTAIGPYAGGGSGTYGVYLGRNAGNINASGKDYQIAIGYETMNDCTGDYAVAIGAFAMSDGDHQRSVAIGYDALGRYLTSSPYYNVAVGMFAGASIYSGDYNTIIGYNAVSEASNQYYLNNCTVLGNAATASSASASNQITLGNSSITSLRCNDTSISTLSDERDKTAIEDLPYGLDFINDMRPVKFTWNRRDGSMSDKPEIGFIAQELYDAELSHSSTRYTRLVSWENPEKLEARPMATYPILVKAVQELSAKCDALEARIAELEGT